MERRHLRQVIHREVKPYYEISEILECGHRFESLILLADPLIARHRVCPLCVLIADGSKKPAQSVRSQERRSLVPRMA